MTPFVPEPATSGGLSAVTRIPWPRDPRYLVGDDGTILGIRGRPRRLQRNPGGYLQLSIDDERGKACSRLVHQIVCETFHGPRPAGLEVAHGDGNQLNNRADNLSWKTHVENVDDRARRARADEAGNALTNALTNFM